MHGAKVKIWWTV